MAYRYEELTSIPDGDGLEQNTWHKLILTPTVFGPIKDLAGYVTWSEPPDLNVQVGGYAAPCWTDNGRYGGTPLIGLSRPILTQFYPDAQGFHMFQDAAVDAYRDVDGFLPSNFGIIYYIKPYMPPMKWRFFGALP